MRVEGKCIGDCSKCELLNNGSVDMVPCILDQMFQRMQRIESKIGNFKKETANIAGVPE